MLGLAKLPSGKGDFIMIKQVGWAALVALGLAGGAVQADDAALGDVLMDQNAGCMEGPMAQFGRYIGDWDIADESLSRTDGTTWQPGNGARWNFTCVGNGIAVQDFWMPNGPDGKPAGRVGTNLRIYDPEAEQWEIAWTATNAPGLMHIQAKETPEGAILMNIISPVQTPPRRITFFPPDAEGWNWVMEMWTDSTNSWTPVYRIRATKRG